MRSYSYEIVFVICLPIPVLNFGLKFEGLIDLGPKWDYVYKLSPINRDILNNNEIIINEPYKNGNDKEAKNDISDKDDLRIEPVEPRIEIPYNNKESLRDELSLELQHDLIDKELNIEHKKQKVVKSNIKKYNRSKKYHKTTKQFDLRNTYMLFDNVKYNSKENRQIEVKSKMDNNFKLNNKNSDSDNEKNEDKYKNNNNKYIMKTKTVSRAKKLNKYKLKDNAKIKNFILHIFKQSLKVFDKMKKLTDEVKIKRRIKLLKNSYIEKFGEFLKDTENHKLKTKLANQNVILNTIDTSYDTFKRLVNYLSTDIDERYNIRNSGLIKIFKREVETGKDIEDKHACNKLAICRTNNEFSDFIIDTLTIILQTNNYKITQAANSLTEIVKTNDLTNVIDYETQNKLRKLMSNIEDWDPFLTRSMFLILRNVIAHKNEPITIMEKADINLANRTVSFYHLIDILNKNMGTVENKSEWKVIKEKLEDWRDGKRSDVQTVLETIIRQIINELEKIDYEQRKDVSDIMKILVN